MDKESIIFFVIFAFWCIPLWFVCDLILWTKFTLHPFTPVGKTIATWVMHILFLTYVPFWATVFTFNYFESGKKK